MKENKYIVYYWDSSDFMVPQISKPLPEKYRYLVWKPTFFQIFPPGLAKIEFVKTWLLYFGGSLMSRGYKVFLINDGKKILHRTVVTGKSLKFPFMDENDYQVGQILTESDYRRKGFALYVLCEIIKALSANTRRFWYIVHINNIASQQLALKAGFRPFGTAIRKSMIGIYIINQSV
jgi:RimJ/RimL family protein N-acetyltransferase